MIIKNYFATLPELGSEDVKMNQFVHGPPHLQVSVEILNKAHIFIVPCVLRCMKCFTTKFLLNLKLHTFLFTLASYKHSTEIQNDKIV